MSKGKVVVMNTTQEITDVEAMNEILNDSIDKENNPFLIRKAFDLRIKLQELAHMLEDKADIVIPGIFGKIDKLTNYTDSMIEYYGKLTNDIYGVENRDEFEAMMKESKALLISLCDKDKHGSPIVDGERYRLSTVEQQEQYKKTYRDISVKYKNLHNRSMFFKAVMDYCVNTFSVCDKDFNTIFNNNIIDNNVKYNFVEYQAFKDNITFDEIK